MIEGFRSACLDNSFEDDASTFDDRSGTVLLLWNVVVVVAVSNCPITVGRQRRREREVELGDEVEGEKKERRGRGGGGREELRTTMDVPSPRSYAAFVD
jgi:hypothetical protein